MLMLTFLWVCVSCAGRRYRTYCHYSQNCQHWLWPGVNNGV